MATRPETLKNPNKLRTLTLIGTGLLGSLALAGCGSQSALVIKTPSCVVMSGGNRSEVVDPVSWPEGAVKYRFDPVDQLTNYPRSQWVAPNIGIMGNTDVQETGYIEDNNGNYYLTTPLLESISSLNSLATNNQEGNFGNNIAVSIELPEYGPVGFTTGCITTTEYNGVNVTAIKLPIAK